MVYNTYHSFGSSAYGGAVCSKGGGTLNISNCTISGNTAKTDNPAYYAYAKGGGVAVLRTDTVSILNSTISGNTAIASGGGYGGYEQAMGGGLYCSVDTGATISNSTISQNALSSALKTGAGVFLPRGTFTINNNILAQNSNNNTDYDYYHAGGTLNDGGYNVVEYSNTAASAPGGFNAVTSILYNTKYNTGNHSETTWTQGGSTLGNQNLSLSSTLSDNGGPTQTLALCKSGDTGGGCSGTTTDSFAIDAIPYDTSGDPGGDVWNGAPTTEGNYYDQRGVETTPDNPICIGAYERTGSTLVELTSFTAKGYSDNALLTWETASELDNAGFYIWRSDSTEGTYSRITQTLIPAKGSPTTGAAYTYRDTDVTAPNVYYYRLEDVSTSGSRSEHGPVSAAVGDAKAKTVTDSGTVGEGDTAEGLGDITIEGTGSHTVATGKYAGRPAATSALSGASGWWTVDVTNPSGVTGLTLRFCPAQNTDTVFFWDGKKWEFCSLQAYENNCLRVTVTNGTEPKISDMSQLVFALVNGNSQIPTLGQWGLILLVMLLASAGGLAMRRKES